VIKINDCVDFSLVCGTANVTQERQYFACLLDSSDILPL
jgi:hypothetical protein